MALVSSFPPRAPIRVVPSSLMKRVPNRASRTMSELGDCGIVIPGTSYSPLKSSMGVAVCC